MVTFWDTWKVYAIQMSLPENKISSEHPQLLQGCQKLPWHHRHRAEQVGQWSQGS